MKHTPGPWIVAGLNVGSVNNKVVASCYKDSLESVVVRPSDDAECLANARLIAAAPDLLDACKAACRSIEDFFADDLPKDWSDSLMGGVDCLRQAIAKATSGSYRVVDED